MLANVERNAYWTDTMLHELGHGSYDVGVDHSLPWLLRTMHLIPTEGIAMLFGRLARDRDWLATVAEVDDTELAPLAERLPAAQAAALLVFARWVSSSRRSSMASTPIPRRMRRSVVGARAPLPARHAARRPPRGLGRRSIWRWRRSTTRTTSTAR